MWVDYRPVDDGYESVYMMLIQEYHSAQISCYLFTNLLMYSTLGFNA